MISDDILYSESEEFTSLITSSLLFCRLCCVFMVFEQLMTDETQPRFVYLCECLYVNLFVLVSGSQEMCRLP